MAVSVASEGSPKAKGGRKAVKGAGTNSTAPLQWLHQKIREAAEDRLLRSCIALLLRKEIHLTAGGSFTSRPAAQYIARTTIRWKLGLLHAGLPWPRPV